MRLYFISLAVLLSVATFSLGQRASPTGSPSAKPGNIKSAELPGWPGAADMIQPSPPSTTKAAAREQLMKAVALLREHKPTEALPLLIAAKTLDPGSYDIQMALGAAYGDARRLDDAVIAFRAAGKLRLQNPSPHAAICRALAITGNYLDAVDECRQAVTLDPTSKLHQVLLARVQSSAGSYEEAVQGLERSGARASHDLTLLGTLGDVYFDAGDYVSAVSVYKLIATEWPRQPLVYGRLAVANNYLGNAEEAIASAKRLAELDANSSSSQMFVGETMQQLGFYEEAIEPLRKATQTDPNLAAGWQMLALSYEILGDQQNLFESLKNAYRLSPNNVQLAFHYGAVAYEFNRPSEAVKPLEYAISRVQDSPDVMRILGLVYMEPVVGEYDKGAELIEAADRIAPMRDGDRIDVRGVKTRQALIGRFDELLALVAKDPNDLKSRDGLVSIYRYKRMLKEAEEQLLEMVKRSPTSELYNYLAVFYGDTGQPEKVIPAVQKAIDLNQKPTHVYYLTLSFSYSQLGRLDEATEAARRSVEVKGTLVTSRDWYGDMLLKKGDREAALKQYQAAFDLESGNPQPNFKLAWLYIRMGNKEGAVRHYGILKGIAPREVGYLERSIIGHFGRAALSVVH